MKKKNTTAQADSELIGGDPVQQDQDTLELPEDPAVEQPVIEVAEIESVEAPQPIGEVEFVDLRKQALDKVVRIRVIKGCKPPTIARFRWAEVIGQFKEGSHYNVPNYVAMALIDSGHAVQI